VERSAIPRDYKNHPKLHSDYILMQAEYYLWILRAVELYNSAIPKPKPMKNLANLREVISITNQYKEMIMTLKN